MIESIALGLVLLLGVVTFVGGGWMAHVLKKRAAPAYVSERPLWQGTLLILASSWVMGTAMVVAENQYQAIGEIDFRVVFGWGCVQGTYFAVAGLTVFLAFSGAFERFFDRVAKGGDR